MLINYKLKISKNDYWFQKLKEYNVDCYINKNNSIHFYFNNYKWMKGYDDTENIEEIFQNIDTIQIEYKINKKGIFILSLLNEYTNFTNLKIIKIMNHFDNHFDKNNVKLYDKIKYLNENPIILNNLLNNLKFDMINIHFHTKKHNIMIKNIKETGGYIELIK